MDPQYSHWTCPNKSPTLSQETNLNLQPSFPSVKGQYQQRQEKTFSNSRKSLHPASSYSSRRQDSSDSAGLASHQYPSPQRFDVNTRPANVLTNDQLQDAIDAAYYKYLLPPDHTSVKAWIHDTILAQIPDSPPSTKTLPLCGNEMKPSLHNMQQQQQSLLSTFAGNSQSSRGTKPSTPSERSKADSGKTFTQSITLDQVDMEYLASCNPSIDLQSPELVRMRYKTQSPKMVRDFLKIWAGIPPTFIPDRLKVSIFWCAYDISGLIICQDYYENRRQILGNTPVTPRKVDFLEGHYAESHHKQLEKLVMVMSQVVERSNRNHRICTSKRH